MRKTALLISALAFCLVLTFSQAFVSQAKAVEPLTSPVTAFLRTIKGNVTLKHIGFWSHAFSRFMPLNHVTVTLWNLNTHETMQTETDADGLYSFMVGKGFYKVMPEIDKSTADFVVPPLRIVHVSHQDKIHVDFQALDLP